MGGRREAERRREEEGQVKRGQRGKNGNLAMSRSRVK